MSRALTAFTNKKYLLDQLLDFPYKLLYKIKTKIREMRLCQVGNYETKCNCPIQKLQNFWEQF